MASGDVIFSATGVTDGSLLDGVHFRRDFAETETVVLRSKTGTVRRIKTSFRMIGTKAHAGHLSARRRSPSWWTQSSREPIFAAALPRVRIAASMATGGGDHGGGSQARAGAGRARGAFLGVDGVRARLAWRERLDPARRQYGRRHQPAPWPAGAAGPRACLARDRRSTRCRWRSIPTIKALMPDPSTLRDMDKARGAACRCHRAQASAIAVFGDYDVDGACSSALMQALPGRARPDGAHLHPRPHDRRLWPQSRQAIESLVKDGAKLIVTVDCGTTSIEPLAVARPLGADVVVVDHHQADERLPDVAARHQSQPAG